MKRPSFQFYPADWKNNVKLRRSSEAARGIWMDILCSLHDEDTYGQAHYPLEELARAASAPLKLVKELVTRGVLKGSDAGRVVHTKEIRHAGKVTEVILIDRDGPCWFSSRMVNDEHSRTGRGASTRFTADNQPSGSPIRRVGDEDGERQVDGATTSTSSTSSKEKTTQEGSAVCVDFDRWLEGFPKKTELVDAKKEFAAALNKTSIDALLSASLAYANSVKDKPIRFIKSPAAWLREERWTDAHAKTEAPSAPRPEPHASWNGKQNALASKIGEDNFHAYFARGRLELGPPAVIEVGSQLLKTKIEQKFGSQLRAMFGSVEIAVVRDASA